MAAPANACMSTGPDGYSTGLVWETKPTNVPADSILLEVTDPRPIADAWAFTARVIAGPDAMQGKRYRFVPMNNTSCVGWGAEEGFMVIRRKPSTMEVAGSEVGVWEVIDYAPTIFNEIMRRIFGGPPWRYPGKPSDRLE